uniref:Uncharacterized protein n=1 Tax=Acrobeloides nanus TaxID=290746 RepID=A0A914CZW8_9BILA
MEYSLLVEVAEQSSKFDEIDVRLGSDDDVMKIDENETIKLGVTIHEAYSAFKIVRKCSEKCEKIAWYVR